jgi:four helix bundle protein
MAIKSYRDLVAWQKSMDLVEQVYKETRAFPKQEMYGLTAQVRRAAVSVPSNIAEGQGRHSDGDFSRHLSIAHGSLCELETQLPLGGRLGYLDHARLAPLLSSASEVGRLVLGLGRAINSV